MRKKLSRGMNIVFSLTSLMFSISLFLFLTGFISFAFGGTMILIVFICSTIGIIIVTLHEHRENSELADLCNCPIEDLYFARNELGWDKDWIKDNVPAFYSRLIEAKRNRGINVYGNSI